MEFTYSWNNGDRLLMEYDQMCVYSMNIWGVVFALKCRMEKDNLLCKFARSNRLGWRHIVVNDRVYI